MNNRVTGVVRIWDDARKFGFVKPDDCQTGDAYIGRNTINPSLYRLSYSGSVPPRSDPSKS